MYDFWDYFWSWVILLSFALPLLFAISIKILLLIGGLFLMGTGFNTSRRERSVRVTVRDYDMDEDN